MITELQWKYAEIERLEEVQRHIYDLPWYSEEFVTIDAAFDDMENRQEEQDIYDNFENPREWMDPTHFDYHHHKPEPMQYYKICTDKITELLK